MKRNVGNFDRILRVLTAIVIAILCFEHVITGTLAVVMLIAGALLVLTAFISICPLYSLFGINTGSVKNAS